MTSICAFPAGIAEPCDSNMSAPDCTPCGWGLTCVKNAGESMGQCFKDCTAPANYPPDATECPCNAEYCLPNGSGGDSCFACGGPPDPCDAQHPCCLGQCGTATGEQVCCIADGKMVLPPTASLCCSGVKSSLDVCCTPQCSGAKFCDTSDDPDNCGSCGHKCGDGTTCSGGHCVCTGNTGVTCDDGTCCAPGPSAPVACLPWGGEFCCVNHDGAPTEVDCAVVTNGVLTGQCYAESNGSGSCIQTNTCIQDPATGAPECANLNEQGTQQCTADANPCPSK